MTTPQDSTWMPIDDCEEKFIKGWKQGHTPLKCFRAPAFGGGFFLAGQIQAGSPEPGLKPYKPDQGNNNHVQLKKREEASKKYPKILDQTNPNC